ASISQIIIEPESTDRPRQVPCGSEALCDRHVNSRLQIVSLIRSIRIRQVALNSESKSCPLEKRIAQIHARDGSLELRNASVDERTAPDTNLGSAAYQSERPKLHHRHHTEAIRVPL